MGSEIFQNWVPSDLQWEVDRAIAQVGGYWRLSAGALRVVEELAELGGVVEHGDRWTEELADFAIIVMCLANQLCVSTRISELRGAHSSGDWARDLLSHAGAIARQINYIDGPKHPRSGKQLDPVGETIRAAIDESYRLASAAGLSLDTAVRLKLKRTSKLDAGRFPPARDTSMDRISELLGPHTRLHDGAVPAVYVGVSARGRDASAAIVRDDLRVFEKLDPQRIELVALDAHPTNALGDLSELQPGGQLRVLHASEEIAILARRAPRTKMRSRTHGA